MLVRVCVRVRARTETAELKACADVHTQPLGSVTRHAAGGRESLVPVILRDSSLSPFLCPVLMCQLPYFPTFIFRESLSFLCRLADLNTHSHTSTLGFVPECCNLRFYEYIQGDFFFG